MRTNNPPGSIKTPKRRAGLTLGSIAAYVLTSMTGIPLVPHTAKASQSPPAKTSTASLHSIDDIVTEFEVSLQSEDGSRVLEGTIRRTVSQDKIPFYVRYEADFGRFSGLNLIWESMNPSSYLHYPLNPNPTYQYSKSTEFTTPHSFEEWEGKLLVHDWGSGRISLYSIEGDFLRDLIVVPSYTIGIARESNLLYAGFNPTRDGVNVYDLTTGRREKVISIGSGLFEPAVKSNLFGIEKEGAKLYLLAFSGSRQRIVVFDTINQKVEFSSFLPEGGEYVGLQLFDGKLYTLNWPQRLVFEVKFSKDGVILEPALCLPCVIPESDFASGGLRGFYFGKEHIYASSVGGGQGGKGVIHVMNYPQKAITTNQIRGNSAEFVFLSNFLTVGTKLLVRDSDGRVYTWQDKEIDLPLHNLTAITLDGTKLFPAESISRISWSASNGDPSDASTFPIANPNSPITTLTSQWPNVLNITATISLKTGETLERNMEALIYFKDGTPFSKRSTAVWVETRISYEQFSRSLEEEMLPLLRRLGMNTLTTAIQWWYDSPDVLGNYTLRPIPISTIEDGWLETLLRVGKERDFFTVVQFTPYPLPQVPPEYAWGMPRVSRGFLYGTGQGFETMLRHYFPMLSRQKVDIVFLGAELTDIDAWGGALSREFFSKMIGELRGQGFGGEVSYALCYYQNLNSGQQIPFTNSHIYFPSSVGIPWQNMDYVGLTFYPALSSKKNPGIQEMFVEANRQIQAFLVPLRNANRKPLYILDFYGFAFEGMAAQPDISSGKYAPEEQLRWATAVLRALSLANADRGNPLIAGITFGQYWLMPNEMKASYPARGVDEIRAYLNSPIGRYDLQKMVMVYFRDVPRR